MVRKRWISLIPDNGKLKVIRHDPRREQLVRIFLLVFIALLAVVTYWYGGSHAGQNLDEAQQQNLSLERQTDVLQEENNELRQRLAILEGASKMDREALNFDRIIFFLRLLPLALRLRLGNKLYMCRPVVLA